MQFPFMGAPRTVGGGVLCRQVGFINAKVDRGHRASSRPIRSAISFKVVRLTCDHAARGATRLHSPTATLYVF